MNLSIEFSHAPLISGVAEQDIIARVLVFENDYLRIHESFLFHALLTNREGRFGHLVAATDPSAFSRAMKDAPHTPAMGALMACFDLDDMRTNTHHPLSSEFRMPPYFGAFEQGLFRPKDPAAFSADDLLRRADDVRTNYLCARPGFLGSTATDAGQGWFAELVFTSSLGHAMETCHGYLDTPVCGTMMELCDPASTEISFWTPLVQRRFERE